MSGGHFCYEQYRIAEIEDQIQELIDTNDDSEYGGEYEARTIARFEQCRDALAAAAKMLHRVDWLVSGDDGEESFHQRWDAELGSGEDGL